MAAGLIVGAMGGVGLWAYLSLVWYIRDLGFWWPTKVVATLWYGGEALVAGRPTDILAVGIAMLVIGYALWGAVFGLFGGMVRFGPAVIAGIVFGVIVWLVDYFVVGDTLLDSVHGTAFIRDQIEWYHALIGHLIYGLVLGLAPAVRPR
jgi:predicted permease